MNSDDVLGTANCAGPVIRTPTWSLTAAPPLDQLVSGVTDYAIFSLDTNGFVTSWNDGARNIKGYAPHEIIGQHFSRFYPADAIERGWPDYELQAARTEGRFEDEGWRLRKDGSSFWANVVITAIRSAEGSLLGFCKITRDLTERRKHEEELRLSDQRLRTLMESLTDHAIFMLDPDGFITSWSTGGERVLGYPAPEIMWKHASNLYRSEDVAADLPWRELAAAARTGLHECEGWRRGKDGVPFEAHAIIRAVYNDRNEPSTFAYILRRHEQPSRQLPQLLERELRLRYTPMRNALDLLQARMQNDPVAVSMLSTIREEMEGLARYLDPNGRPAGA